IAALLHQRRPDLVIVLGSRVVPTAAVEQLRGGGDARWVQVLGDDLRDADGAAQEAAAYHDVFVPSSATLQHFDRYGIKHAHYLALGCDPSVHKPLRARGPFRANIVFVGSANSRRERFLSELVEFGLAVWGHGWRKTSLKDYCRGELPGTEDFVRAYAGATVAVNIHRTGSDDRNDPAGVNRRTFELAAIGVTQVVDHRHDLPSHFEDASEVLTYATPEELKGQVKRAVQEDRYRERLAEAARQRALREHTYMHRMGQLLRTTTGNE
ncbi:MAG TPA: glycosyltransferase, partial [Gemmatimonadales bacterium]|nr:glycosyltransferase [Gemmatimonadales bacterium]